MSMTKTNWQEANKLDVYNCGRGVELGTTDKKIQPMVRANLRIVSPKNCSLGQAASQREVGGRGHNK